MKNILLLALAGLLLASCSTTKRATRQTSETASTVTATATEGETTKITHRRADTSVTVPADSVAGTISVKPTGIGSDSVSTQVIESGTMVVTATVNTKTGTVDIKAKTKDRQVTVPVEETIIETGRQKTTAVTATETESKTDIRTKETEPVSIWWYVKQLWWLLLILIALYMVWKHRPTITNVVKRYFG